MILDDTFLQAIRTHPHDDAPRLIYADWLEEHGETDRAEFIRLQCGDEDHPRQLELLQRYGPAWAEPLTRLVYGYAFRRGFIEEVTIDAKVFADLGPRLFDAAPIRLLRLVHARAVLDRLLSTPQLAQVCALHLTDCRISDEGTEQLATCPYLGGLQTLRLGNNALADRAAEALASSPYLGRLQTLILHGNQIGDLGARLLAASETLPSLAILDLSDNQIGDAGAEALARSTTLGRLRRLDLSHQFKGWSAGLALRGRPYPIQPKQQRALLQRFGPQTCAF